MFATLSAVEEMIVSIMLSCPLLAKILQSCAEINQKGCSLKPLIFALQFKLLNALGQYMTVDFYIEMSNQ